MRTLSHRDCSCAPTPMRYFDIIVGAIKRNKTEFVVVAVEAKEIEKVNRNVFIVSYPPSSSSWPTPISCARDANLHTVSRW